MDIDFRDDATDADLLHFTDAILQGESNLNANLANMAAMLGQYLPKINWIGFYLWESHTGEWVLGPFAGRPACTRIGPHQGVVGTALSQAQPLVVPNVLEFPGHIACDDRSRSEVVIPIVSQHQVVAGLDVDSPEFHRFSETDVDLLSMIGQKLGRAWASLHWY